MEASAPIPADAASELSRRITALEAEHEQRAPEAKGAAVAIWIYVVASVIAAAVVAGAAYLWKRLRAAKGSP